MVRKLADDPCDFIVVEHHSFPVMFNGFYLQPNRSLVPDWFKLDTQLILHLTTFQSHFDRMYVPKFECVDSPTARRSGLQLSQLAIVFYFILVGGFCGFLSLLGELIVGKLKRIRSGNCTISNAELEMAAKKLIEFIKNEELIIVNFGMSENYLQFKVKV